MESRTDFYKAILIGGAYGDTLGMPIEGWNRNQIRRYAGFIRQPKDPIIVKDLAGNIIHSDEDGRIPYVSPYLKAGQITDDTWTSIATGRSIIAAEGLDLDSLATHNLEIYHEQMKRFKDISSDEVSIAAFIHPDGEIPQPFGGTTIAAYQNLDQGIPPADSGVMSRNPGNGPVIKIAAAALYMHATNRYQQGLEFSEAAGKMTHLDPRSIVAGVLQAHAVYSNLSGLTRDEFLRSLPEVCREFEKSQDFKVTMLERISWVVSNKDVDNEEAYSRLTPTWPVTKNYPFTLFMFQKYWDNLLEGLYEVINSGGDCDSTGAIYGALMGAKAGMIFPQEHTNMIEQKDELEQLATGIWNLKTTF